MLHLCLENNEIGLFTKFKFLIECAEKFHFVKEIMFRVKLKVGLGTLLKRRHWTITVSIEQHYSFTIHHT